MKRFGALRLVVLAVFAVVATACFGVVARAETANDLARQAYWEFWTGERPVRISDYWASVLDGQQFLFVDYDGEYGYDWLPKQFLSLRYGDCKYYLIDIDGDGVDEGVFGYSPGRFVVLKYDGDELRFLRGGFHDNWAGWFIFLNDGGYLCYLGHTYLDVYDYVAWNGEIGHYEEVSTFAEPGSIDPEDFYILDITGVETGHFVSQEEYEAYSAPIFAKMENSDDWPLLSEFYEREILKINPFTGDEGERVMSLIQAVILGILQGLTEFLPVSSSGHLTLAQALFGVSDGGMTFDVAVHLGTLVAVFVALWGDVWALLKKPWQKLTWLLVVGTLPAVLAALLLGDLIDALYEGRPLLLAGAFVVTGILLIICDFAYRPRRGRVQWGDGAQVGDMTFFQALVVGLFQAVAITPGLSRSGATITGGVVSGLSRETAARFSFLLSIPAVLGALALQFRDIYTGKVAVDAINPLTYGAGFVAAGLSGFLAINFMLSLVKKAKLRYFSIYVFAVAVVTVVFRAKF